MGISWEKAADQIAVTFLHLKVEPTKRGILQKLVSCFSSVGLTAPILLVRKSVEIAVRPTITRSISEEKYNWETNLSATITAPRAFQLHQEKTEAIDFDMFCDASIIGTAAAIYVVIYQAAHLSQCLVTAKAQLSRKDLTIPKPELVAMHMAANLCQNLKSTLEGKPIRNFYG